jgi:hypothetical protein
LVRVVTSDTRLVETSDIRGFLGCGGGLSSRAPLVLDKSRGLEVEKSRDWLRKSKGLETGVGFNGTTTEGLKGFDVRSVWVMYFEENVVLLCFRMGLKEGEDTRFDRLGHRMRCLKLDLLGVSRCL